MAVATEKSGGQHCPACGHDTGSLAFDYPNHPTFLFPAAEAQAKRIVAAALRIHACSDCGHLFQIGVDPELLLKIYGEYYRDYPYDTGETMQGPYRQPFNAMVNLVLGTRPKRPDARLVEIGCSRAENLAPFADMGFSCIGVDPSPLATAHEKIRLIAGYYETTDIGGPADVVISRFNLEHIVDLDAFMRKVTADLRDDGVVLVQVPNVEYYFRNRQPLFAAHEHIHYFSLNSLDALFARHGFGPLSFYADGQPSIIACYSRNAGKVSIAAPNLQPAIEPFKTTIAARRARLVELLQQPKQVVLYGCGLSMFWILPALLEGGDKSIQIVDDNPNVQGKYLPVYGLPVAAATPEAFAGCEAVVLTLNPIYHARVRQRLEGMGQALKIIALGSETVDVFDYQRPGR